jgi:hypothetical protein
MIANVINWIFSPINLGGRDGAHVTKFVVDALDVAIEKKVDGSH